MQFRRSVNHAAGLRCQPCTRAVLIDRTVVGARDGAPRGVLVVLDGASGRRAAVHEVSSAPNLPEQAA